MALFPLKKERRALSKIVAVDFIEVHCICRLPEGIHSLEEWGRCTKCLTWYHTNQYLRVSKADLQGKWLCPNLCLIMCSTTFFVIQQWHLLQHKLNSCTVTASKMS